MRAELQVEPQRPTLGQWLKALLAGLFDADVASHNGVPPSSSYDPSSDCQARVTLLDGDVVIWESRWTADIARAEADCARLTAAVSQLGEEEARRRAKAGTLLAAEG